LGGTSSKNVIESTREGKAGVLWVFAEGNKFKKKSGFSPLFGEMFGEGNRPSDRILLDSEEKGYSGLFPKTNYSSCFGETPQEPPPQKTAQPPPGLS